MSRNLAFERYAFDEFSRLRPDLRLAHIEQPEPPAPDILCDHQGCRLGIEITRYLQEGQKQRESEEDRIVERARHLYEDRETTPVGLSIHWVKHEARPSSDRAVLAESLVEAVVQNRPLAGGRVSLDWSSLPDPLAKSVDCLIIDRVIDYTENDWRLPRAAFIPEASINEIREIIEGKRDRYLGYRGYCNSVWLLIVSEGLGPSSWCELPETTRQHCFVTRFSRVFFLRIPTNVVELFVKEPEPVV
jgi:hypothetical protein